MGLPMLILQLIMAFFFTITSNQIMENAIAQTRSLMSLTLHRSMGADPVQVVGNTIIVHLDPSYDRNALIEYFVKNGIAIGTSDFMHDIVHGVQPLQVTQLYPWNHPADEPERVWPLSPLSDTGYYDENGKPFPPPPKLVRTSNHHECPDDKYFDCEGDLFPVKLSNNELESLKVCLTDELDFSANAPFSPRQSPPRQSPRQKV